MPAGKVYLVGAGPGHPGLLTLRGRRCLEEAEVIVYDYLANPVLLEYAPADAERICAGKHGAGGPRIMGQDEINAILIERAAAGKVVVRLKGGDPFIFGRGGEEAQALAAAGIPFEVVPGVTSAIAAPAYAGIPLTHREASSAVTFVTGHQAAAGGAMPVPWQALVEHGGTLVFLMSVTTLAATLGNLVAHGMDPGTPAALVRWGTTAAQETIVGTAGSLAAEVERRRLRPPGVLVVGEVVRLREKIAWFERGPLFGRRVIVTRPREQAAELVARLEELGAEVLLCPAITIVPPASYEALDRAVAAAGTYDWIVFTSANGVESFFARLDATGGDIRQLGGARLAAIGPATAAALRRRHLRVAVVPEEYRAEGVVDALGAGDLRGRRVLLPRAAGARPVLPEELTRRGAAVDEVEAYRTELAVEVPEEVRRRLEARDVDCITFTSSSTVRGLLRALGKRAADSLLRCRRPVIACIGPVTAEAARKAGLEVAIMPREYTVPALAAAIAAHFRDRGG